MAHELGHWEWTVDPTNRKRKIRVDPDTGQKVTQKQISKLKTQRDLNKVEGLRSKFERTMDASDATRMRRWEMIGSRAAGQATQVDPSQYNLTPKQQRKYTGGNGQYFKSQGHLNVVMDEDAAAVQQSLSEAEEYNKKSIEESVNRENEKGVKSSNTGKELTPKSKSDSSVDPEQTKLKIDAQANDSLAAAIEKQLADLNEQLPAARKADLAPLVASGERMADGGSTVFTKDMKLGRSGMQNERGIQIMTRAERRKYDAKNPFEGAQEKAIKDKIAGLKPKPPAPGADLKAQNLKSLERTKELNQLNQGINTTDQAKAGAAGKANQGGMNIGLGKSGISVNTKTGKVSGNPLLIALKIGAAVLASNRKPAFYGNPGGGTSQLDYDPYRGMYTG